MAAFLIVLLKDHPLLLSVLFYHTPVKDVIWETWTAEDDALDSELNVLVKPLTLGYLMLGNGKRIDGMARASVLFLLPALPTLKQNGLLGGLKMGN
jgi:hypothetical protein